MSKVIQIQDVAELNRATYKRDEFPAIVNYLDTSSLTKNRIEGFQILNTNTDEIPSRAQRKVKRNTILYSTVRPNQEHYGIIENHLEDVIVSTGFTTLDVFDETINPKYLYYLLTQPQITEYLHTIASNSVSAYPSILPSDLGNLTFRIPELSIQNKIASVLSALDSKIELNNRINAELEAMAKMLYDYWFVQFDFPDKDGKPYMSSGGKMVWCEELKREVPKGWKFKTLADITSFSNESINPMDFPDKEYNYYSIPGFDESGTFQIEKGCEIKSNKYTVTESDILVSKLNPWFSRIIYATGDVDLICSTEFVVWRTPSLELKNYLYMIARDYTFTTYCTKSASGTSNSHKRINPSVMMKYSIAFDENVALLYGKSIGSSIKLLAKNLIENKRLTDLRDWLLPMLMNGQVKVK